MERRSVVLVRCVFLRSGFPGERPFVIRFPGGGEFRGAVSSRFCYGLDKRPFVGEPVGSGEIAGFVPGIVIGDEPSGQIRLQLPDGDVYLLDADLIEPRRLEATTA